MKVIIYFLLIIFCFSCKTSVNAQQKEKQKQSVTNKKPKYEDTYDRDSQIEPNAIQFIGKVLSIEKKDTLICEMTHKFVATIEIVNLQVKGSSIINVCNKGEQLKMVFIMGFSKVMNNTNTVVYPGIKEGQIFKAEAYEKLCPNISKTNYFVSSYTLN